MSQKNEQKQYKRFTASQRFEHFIVIVTFTGLALTGLPQRYASASWSQSLIDLLGGIESVRIIHRFLATLLMAEAIYHGGVISYKLFVLGKRAIMIPSMRDIRDVIDWVRYNLGLKPDHPHLPRYNFGEKAEYLAVVWGTILMVITGFIMWNPIAAAKLLPSVVIPASRAAHGAEAVLAVASIAIWHMYNVHFRRFNRSMFTGNLSHEAMVEEHGEELEMIEQGQLPPRLPEEIIAKRKRRFTPYAVGMTILLGAGLIWFITFEESSITTVPPQDVVAFAPQVTPESGDAAVGAAIWPTLRCGYCHGEDGGGGTVGPALRGTTLSFDEFFEKVRGGSEEMPSFSAEEIPDAFMLHLWTWLTEQ